MKELTRTRRLTVASILFVVLIGVGLITLNKPEFEYQVSPEVMLEELYNLDNEMTPDEAMEILAYGDSAYVFVDVRNPNEYQRGFLGDAINIPVSDILDEGSLDFYRFMAEDSVTIVFYGKDQRAANAPWMLLKQLGFTNMKVLLGGYDYLADENLDYYDMPEIPKYFVEEPAMDFGAFMEDIGSIPLEQASQEPKEIVPIKRKKKTISEGGC